VRRSVDEERGTRLNKCLPRLSRRAADAAIEAGRVSVGGVTRRDPGYRCGAGEVVCLDGATQDWARHEAARRDDSADFFAYVKYWKPRGVTCTTDRRVDRNIVEPFDSHFEQRVFPVGRLDKDSTGLILLTSDGRLAEALLRPRSAKTKVYEVDLDRRPSDEDLRALRSGVVITTVAQRKRKKPLTAATRPCDVERRRSSNGLVFTLTEGRNRQIRRMCDARGLHVRTLHRTAFAGITLAGLRQPGDWALLDRDERQIIRAALASS